ncbi:hypothetical protein KVV02_001048 [Mortierella alpina]|uniref:DUF423-domain-containing protein n=1 Tax=Mortierella alpina TaxID=64518 RepID=A0A9P8A9Z4_MORAP|nr:hypothetical protein KVV02_001048 [Mortierella alpina]
MNLIIRFLASSRRIKRHCFVPLFVFAIIKHISLFPSKSHSHPQVSLPNTMYKSLVLLAAFMLGSAVVQGAPTKGGSWCNQPKNEPFWGAASATCSMASLFYLRAASILGGVGVLAAAYGAHGLEKRVNNDVGKLKAWSSAANIQLIHAAALLAISQSPVLLARTSRYAAPLMLVGTTLFSGSIYALILDTEKKISRALKLGPMTPLGGIVLVAAWGSLAF